MGKIWFTSDWHFCHSKSFLWMPRGFKDQYEMNAEIIKRHNEVVSPEDDVYCLGDCMLEDNVEGLKCIKQLKGNIHIIRGNHDTDTRMGLYDNCYNIIEVCEGKFLKYGRYNFYLSHYPTLTSNCDEDKPLDRRIISLCGHSHTADKFADFKKGLIYHCEVDAHDCYPVCVDDIITDVQKKINKMNEFQF